MRKAILLYLFMVLSGIMAVSAQAAETVDYTSSSVKTETSYTYSSTMVYLLCLRGWTDQTIGRVGPGSEWTDTWQVGLVVASLREETTKTVKPPDGPPSGPCDPGGGGINYPPTDDPPIWDPGDPSGELPCPPETDPNFPGDQPPYVDIPEQTWSPP